MTFCFWVIKTISEINFEVYLYRKEKLSCLWLRAVLLEKLKPVTLNY